MTAAREDLLSPDELRKRLYQTFKSKGVLDTLKTQLRNQLIQELKDPLLSGGDSVPRPVSPRPDSLLVSASNTIVADYLKTSGHEYTLSVFYPESGLRKDKILSTKDLLQFMKISHHSPLYKSLTSNEAEAETGFLTGLLTHLADPCGHRSCSDADTQTASAGSHRESLVDKMKMIDQEYEGLHHRGDKGTSCESKLAAYKRELETQMHAEMNLKMQHFKDVELARVKMDEQTRSQKEFSKFRQDVEKTYEMKANALMNREKNAIDRLQKQQEMDENNVYMQRQMLLKEIEKVRNRENDLKIRMEGFEKTCEMHADKVKAMEDLLRRRELAVRTSEDTYEQKLLNEISRCKLELKEEFTQRTEQLTENENRNKVETARIQKETAALAAKTDEHLEACAELRRMQGALETSEQQASLLGQQKELLRERLEAMSDYSGLKREKVELQGELQLLRRQLEEAQEEGRLLHSEAARPSEEQLTLQKELQRLQGARRQEQEESDRQRQVLQAQLQGEAERCALLTAQLMESEEKSHWLNTHTEEMKLQLRQTQQALENEVLRNPKPSLVDRSVLELSTDTRVPPDVYVQRPFLLGHYDDAPGGGVGIDVGVGEARGALRGRAPPRWAPSVSPEPEETELLAGAKARIRELEREAETLEEAYRSYQQRALRVPVAHLLSVTRPYSPPPRPYSPPLPPPPARHAHSRAPPTRRPPPAHRSRPPSSSPRRSQVPAAPSFSPPPPQRHISRLPPMGTPSPDSDATPPPCSRAASTERSRRWPAGPGGDPDLRSFTDPSSVTRSPPRSSSRRLSSSPLFGSRQRPRPEHTEEVMAFPELSPEGGLSPQGGLSPAPLGDQTPPSEGAFSPDLSPPHAPQLQSTARDQTSPLRPHQPFSSSESSPRPEEIHLEDLSTTLPEPGSIPELLLDTAAPREDPGPAVPPPPAPQDPQETPVPQRGQSDAAPGETAAEERKEESEEERSRERERKERRERRQREQEEAKQREQEELSRLERETTLLELKNAERRDGEDEREEKEEAVGEEKREEKQREEEEDGSGVARSPAEDPLQKYMKMVLEARGAKRAQSPARAEPEASSPDVRSLSEERGDSIAAFSHEDLDDDFW